MTEATGQPRQQAIVIGAGIAGLSAAFYLAERGFAVEVYEKASSAGGNLGAVSADSKVDVNKPKNIIEVYPHLFGDWYINFWDMMDKIGRGKTKAKFWRRMEEFKTLRRPKNPADRYKPIYRTLKNNGDLTTAVSNLLTGPLPVPDMFLAGYASLGAMSENFKTDDPLTIASLGDFLSTRFYSSKYVTQFYQDLILNVWSIQPDATSAYACQRFFRYQAKDPVPTAWVLNSGNAFDDIIQPLVDYLQSDQQGVIFHFNSTVVGVSLNDQNDLVDQIIIRDGNNKINRLLLNNQGGHRTVVVLALPPETLAALVQTPIFDPPIGEASIDHQISLKTNRHGIITHIKHSLQKNKKSVQSYRHTIVKGIPALASSKVLSAEPLPVIYILFKPDAAINKLVPEGCYIGLDGSKYSLTLVELKREFTLSNPSHTADAPCGSVIALAASNYSQLPMFQNHSDTDDLDQARSDSNHGNDQQSAEDYTKHLILEEAMNYLPFTFADIKVCFFRTNQNHRLFLNDVQSVRYPVQTFYKHGSSSFPLVKNLAFAGDYCSNNVVMSTVEAAVESGFNAGKELVDHLATEHHISSSHRQKQPLTLQSPNAYPKALIGTAKLLLTPTAVLAKSWSDLNDLVEDATQSSTATDLSNTKVLAKAFSYYPRQASMVMEAYRDAFDTMNLIATSTVTGTAKLISAWFNRR